MEEAYIDFYRDRDEQNFLDRYEQKHGTLSDDVIDELYATIADSIEADIENNHHKIGDPYYYNDILVGKSDYNQIQNLYLFEDM